MNDTDMPPGEAMSFFSVIIPTYNRAEKAVRAIRSVLRQRHGDYEIIVIDDGSTDDTMTRLREFGSSIRCQYQRNTGVSAARQRGITIAGGRYISLLDSDDEWLPEKIAEHRRDH